MYGIVIADPVWIRVLFFGDDFSEMRYVPSRVHGWRSIFSWYSSHNTGLSAVDNRSISLRYIGYRDDSKGDPSETLGDLLSTALRLVPIDQTNTKEKCIISDWNPG